MSTNTAESSKVLQCEKEFIKFLTKMISRGCIKLQHIIKHLEEASPEVQKTIGASESKILNFIKKHKDIFNIDNNILSLYNNSVKDEDCYKDMRNIRGTLPNEILNGMGVIVRLQPTWGIINIEDPIETSVYFSTINFLHCYKEEVNLTNYGLNIGTMVTFNAVRDKRNCFTTEYRATKVWKKIVDEENIHTSKNINKTILHTPKNIDGEGVISRVFPNFGFISVNGDKNNSVYFCKKDIVDSDDIIDLSQIFKERDLVKFSAEKSDSKFVTAAWVANKVWKKSNKNGRVKTQIEDIISKPASNIADRNWADLPSETCSTNSHLTKNTIQNEMMHNAHGKICPRSNGTVIKFGENFSKLADGDSSVYYICGAEVTEISWEFSEGEDVMFDAVKIKPAPGWKAVLVWKGDKPNVVLRTCLGDFSEFTDDDEISEDSAGSGNQLSLSSNVSEKSLNIKSQFNHSKSIRSSEMTSKLQDLNIPVTNLNSTDKIFERMNLPSFNHHPQNNLLLSKESLMSDILQKEKADTNELNSWTCQSVSNSVPIRVADELSNAICTSVIDSVDIPLISVKLKKDKASANGLNNTTCKSDTDSVEDILKYESDMSTISSFNNEPLSDVQDNKLRSISNCSSLSFDINNQNKVQHSNQEYTEQFVKLNKNNNMENVEISDSNNTQANIKKLEDITGKIIKVYSKSAKIKSSKVSNFLAFSSKIFYSVQNKNEKLQDLRKLLKVGDSVQFNYFEIVDDFGHIWNEVSFVWSGRKPLIFHECPIADIIQQNNLTFTIGNKTNKSPPEQYQQAIKGFVPFDDASLEDNVDGFMAQTESNSGVGGDAFDFPLSSKKEEILLLTEQIKKFSDISIKILENNATFGDTKVDFNCLATEIANLALKHINPKENVNSISNASFLTKDQFVTDSTKFVTMSNSSYEAEMVENSNQSTEDADVGTGFTLQQIFNLIVSGVLFFLLFIHFTQD